MDEFLLKLYRVMISFFLVMFVLTVCGIIFNIGSPTHVTWIEALGYLILINQNSMLYNQKRIKIENKKQKTN